MNIYPGGSIVIPVYNGADCLPELVEQLAAVLPTWFSEYEVILVNDGSPDGSWQCIETLSRRYPWIQGINLRRNYGQHNATLCGIRRARYAITVTMDDDLQHPPQEIGKLLAKLAEGNDVVYGFPNKLPHSFWRNIFSVFSKWIMSRVMGIPTIRNIGSFRAFYTDLRQAFESYQNPNVLVDVLLSWGTTRFAVVNVDEVPRQKGTSNYNFRKLMKAAMLILTGFSTIPLRFTSLVGFGFTLFGILILVYVLVVTLTQGSIPGFPFLASIIALFSGVQLFALGIMGEYMARIFDRSMERPPYVVGTIVGQQPEINSTNPEVEERG
jgi:glycosyltransferase involved in cell wall biosynthesis